MWLHRQHILHLDLKTENLMMKGSTLKVGDFGLSSINDDDDDDELKDDSGGGASSVAEQLGSIIIRAPEIMAGKAPSKKSDVYSFGIVLWELATLRVPWAEVPRAVQVMMKVCAGERPPLFDWMPESLRTLIEDCWNHDAELRPSFTEVLPRLYDIILEVSIADPVGRMLWRRCFGAKVDEVPWAEFWPAFLDHFDIAERIERHSHGRHLERALRAVATESHAVMLASGAALTSPSLMMASSSAASASTYVSLSPSSSSSSSSSSEQRAPHRLPSMVTMQSFSHALQSFGPLRANHPNRLLTRIYSVLRAPYFHGPISKADSEELLLLHKAGSFLVRFSSEPGHYTISVRLKAAGQAGHIRLGRGGKNVCENFPSFLKQKGRKYGLRTPCPGSPYATLFADLDRAQQPAKQQQPARVDPAAAAYMAIRPADDFKFFLGDGRQTFDRRPT
jgi:serine/threonine protein kinase